MIYGDPEIHKSNIPLRSIISDIGTEPHIIAKCIAKILTFKWYVSKFELGRIISLQITVI